MHIHIHIHIYTYIYILYISLSRWGVPFEQGISIYHKILSYGYAAMCVTDWSVATWSKRKKNPDWSVAQKDISVEHFTHAVKHALCIDWEFWVRDSPGDTESTESTGSTESRDIKS
jgi:hypothetical protein